MRNKTATIKTLAYANLDIATDNPDAFDISSINLNVMTVDCYPRIACFVVERRETECEDFNYSLVYNNIEEACEEFKKVITKYGVTKVGIATDINDYLYDDEPYIPCATYGDYGPSNPWDAPGMSIHDFI